MIRALVLTVPLVDLELASDRLWEAGAQAVEERQGSDDLVELWTTLSGDDGVTATRLGVLPAEWSVGFVLVDPTPSDEWRNFVRPIRVADDLIIRPAWLPPLLLAGVDEVVIEPAAAFGLGDHPTTILSAAAVRRLVRAGESMLDVGCGTGVLAIIAALAGARRVIAVDIADAAVEATIDNAKRNGVVDLIDVSVTPVEQVVGEFDLVVANILAPVLVSMADSLRQLTASTGRLVIAGILLDRHDHVLAALSPMVTLSTHHLDGWAVVELRHPE